MYESSISVEIEKIDNGYVVLVRGANYSITNRRYCENINEVFAYISSIQF